MSQLSIFVIRAFVGLAFAAIVTRMFYGRITPVYVAGLAIILVGLAYFAEYLRKRKNRWILTQTRPPRLSPPGIAWGAADGGRGGSRWRAGNAADGSLRLALWVKIDEKNRLSSDLKYKNNFSLIFIQDLGNDWVETIGQRIR